MKNTRLTKRHEGLHVSFAAFDGKTYFGNLLTIRNRVVSVNYHVPNFGGVIAYLIGEQIKRAKHDMELIRSDVERKDWQSVINGVKYQVKAFSELLEHLRNLDAKGLLYDPRPH